MVPSGVLDLVGRPHRHFRVDKLGISLDEANPLVILGHGDGAGAELVNGIVSGVGLPFQDAGISIVRLLDLAHDDRFEFAAGCLEVQIRLDVVSMMQWSSSEDGGRGWSSYLM